MVVSQALQGTLDILFATGGIAAIAAITSSWMSFAPQFRSLRSDLSQTGGRCDFRYKVTSIQPHHASAKVTRLSVRRQVPVRADFVRIAAGLRAAA